MFTIGSFTLSEDEVRKRRAYYEIGPDDERRLRDAQTHLRANAREIIDRFYAYLLSHEHTRRVVESQIDRLKQLQTAYFDRLTSGTYDLAYFEDRLRVGLAHQRIGLSPEWYLGAYNLYLSLIFPMMHEEYRGRPAEFLSLFMAFRKVVFFDIGLAIEAYIQKANEKLEYANRELAVMAKELGRGLDRRTQELMHSREQLEQAERLAELGTLASGMAHEIGTPMNVILGRAEFLQRKTKDSDTAKGLQTIIDQVERITRIMNQLLTFARRRPIERRPVDLNKVVADTLDVMRERFKRHRIKVTTVLKPALPPVDGNPDQIGQVLLNLAINALHAIGDDGTIEVRTAVASVSEHPGQSPTEMIELSVSDSGHGIAQDDLDKIFNPFFTTKEFGKGTGLGLTVVHGIVQEHGGQIRVESEVQRGTTFRIRLPIASARP